MIKLLELSTHKLSWGEIYYGLKKGFINAKFILENYDKNRILFYPEHRYIELLLSFENSQFEMLKIIKKYINEDDFTNIIHNENNIIENIDFTFILEKYKVFWNDLYELSILKDIIYSKEATQEKFYKLYLHHSDVEYKKEWNRFINFYFNGQPNVNEEDLYIELISYFNTIKNKVLKKG